MRAPGSGAGKRKSGCRQGWVLVGFPGENLSHVSLLETLGDPAWPPRPNSASVFARPAPSVRVCIRVPESSVSSRYPIPSANTLFPNWGPGVRTRTREFCGDTAQRTKDRETRTYRRLTPESRQRPYVQCPRGFPRRPPAWFIWEEGLAPLPAGLSLFPPPTASCGRTRPGAVLCGDAPR